MSFHVLHLCSSLGMFGGENVLLSLVKEMKTSQYTPVIGILKNSYNPHTELAEEAANNMIEHVVFECDGRLDFKTLFSIRNYLIRYNIKIIHTHDYKSDSYGLLASCFTQACTIATCHNWITNDTKMAFYALVDKLLLGYFDYIVTVSPVIQDTLLKRGIMPEKTEVIYNGVYLDRYCDDNSGNSTNLRTELGLPAKCQVIGVVGRLSSEKGYTFFLKAAQKILEDFRNVYFLIVGDGPQREELSSLCSTLNIKTNVIFTGIRSDVEKIYTLLDIFVISSLTEGLPMTLLEAMASHKPIISTNVGAIPHVIEHGVNGLLVETGNVMQLVSSIKMLLKNKEQASSLAQKGLEKVRSRFSSKAMAEQYFNVYQRVIE